MTTIRKKKIVTKAVKGNREMFLELLNKPATKYILGGFALGVLVNYLRKVPEVNDYAVEKFRLIKNRFDHTLDAVE